MHFYRKYFRCHLLSAFNLYSFRWWGCRPYFQKQSVLMNLLLLQRKIDEGILSGVHTLCMYVVFTCFSAEKWLDRPMTLTSMLPSSWYKTLFESIPLSLPLFHFKDFSEFKCSQSEKERGGAEGETDIRFDLTEPLLFTKHTNRI